MKYPRHEYATILVSTMTEEELLNNEYIKYEDFHAPFLMLNQIPRKESLQRARKYLIELIKEEDWATDLLNLQKPKFYQSEYFIEHYKIFALHMKKFICPICKQPLVKKINRRTHKEIIGCSSYPTCNFIFDPESYIEVLDTAYKNHWIDL